MNPSKFDRDIAVNRLAPDLFEADISPDWNIAAPNGGYLMSILGNAMMRTPEYPVPLSLSVYYHKPTRAEKILIHLKDIATGPRLKTWHARVMQNDAEIITALASFSKADAFHGMTLPHPPPELPDFRKCVRFLKEDIVFFRQVALYLPASQLAWTSGELGDEGRVTGWLEFPDGRGMDALSLLLFADATFPPVMRRTGGLAWVPTIEISVQVRGIPEGHRVGMISQTRFVTDGLQETDVELYSESGKLVALSRQIALIRERKAHRKGV